jgi:hypothetical protein
MMMIPTGAMAATKQSATTYVQGTSAAGDVLNGVLKVTSFANQGGQLVAQGLLNGTLTSASGVVTPIVNLPVTAPVSGVSGSCQILNLVLGPLDLNLLGLTIHLNQVVLNITAVSGHGNLLGNLLCAVANLLNSGNLSNLLNQLATLLNQILAAL